MTNWSDRPARIIANSQKSINLVKIFNLNNKKGLRFQIDI